MGRRPSTVCETLAELMRGPGTRPEIAFRCGDKRRDQIATHIKTLRVHGLIYISGWQRRNFNGPWVAIWALQTMPFEKADATQPVQMKAVPKKPPAKRVPVDVFDTARLVIDTARGITRHHCL